MTHVVKWVWVLGFMEVSDKFARKTEARAWMRWHCQTLTDEMKSLAKLEGVIVHEPSQAQESTAV